MTDTRYFDDDGFLVARTVTTGDGRLHFQRYDGRDDTGEPQYTTVRTVDPKAQEAETP
jgi:hypothetical protein